MRISIIVPVFNEIGIIKSTLVSLQNSLSELNTECTTAWEVIVSDSGSSDGTSEIIEEFCRNKNQWTCEIKKIENPSIGKTIKKAIGLSKGELLLILPCDTRLNSHGFLELSKAYSLNEKICGGFNKFYEPNTFFLKLYGWVQNNVRLKLLKHLVWTNGIFFSKTLLTEFQIPTMGFLEDVYLSDFLRSTPHFKKLKGPLFVSSRRYITDGIAKRMIINFIVICFFRLRIFDTEKLKSIYKF